MRSVLAALAVFLSLSACAASTGEDQKSWIGLTDTALIAHAGAPDAQADSANGMRTLTYFVKRKSGAVACKQNYTVDAKHIIRYVSNNCPY